MGVEADIVDKSGSWYSYKGEKIGQGKDNARDFLKANPALSKEIEGLIREKLSTKSSKSVIAGAEVDEVEPPEA